MSKWIPRVFISMLAAMALCVAGGSDAWAASGAVYGYGTVAAENGLTCDSPPTTPQASLFNGARCKALNGDVCKIDDRPGIWIRTCTANVKASPGSAGWRFSGWSGGCDGSEPTCAPDVSREACTVREGVRDCDPVVYSDPAVAHFEDIHAPVVTFSGGPAEGAVVASGAAQFGLSVSEPEEKPSVACSLDGGQASCTGADPAPPAPLRRRS